MVWFTGWRFSQHSTVCCLPKCSYTSLVSLSFLFRYNCITRFTVWHVCLLNICVFGEAPFFGDLWNLSGVDINFRCKILLYVVRIVCSARSTASFGSSLYFPSNIYFWFLSSKNVYGYWKFPQTSFIGFLFGDLWDQWIFPQPLWCGPLYLISHFALQKLGLVSVVLERSLFYSLTKSSYYLWVGLLIRFCSWFSTVI